MYQGIGFESHFFQILLPNLAAVDTNMGRFLSLGNESWPMELHVTELDVDLGFTLGWAAGRYNTTTRAFRVRCPSNRPIGGLTHGCAWVQIGEAGSVLSRLLCGVLEARTRLQVV